MRECGDCSLCCKLPGVYGGDVQKPPDKWCEHCAVGSGCKRYETRPDPCRNFECLWLVNPLLPEELKPSRCHVVMYELPDDIKEDPKAFKDWLGMPVRIDAIVLEDSNYYRHGESLHRTVVRKAVDVIKARGCSVAVLNKGKARLV